MKIERIPGTDDRVYPIIGPFAMNQKRINENGNPITTSNKHYWYIGYNSKNEITGFCSVKFSDATKNMQIGNIFILQGKKRTFSSLIKHIIQETAIDKGLGLRAYANNSNIDDFKKLGFEVVKPGVNWHNMKYNDSIRSGK